MRPLSSTPLIFLTLAGAACAASATTEPNSGTQLSAEPTAQTASQESVDSIKPLSEIMPEVKQPALWIGDDAPPLTIASYVKGESIGEMDPDMVYVVEFWATWCGPCIAAFPHLTELQEQYSDSVRFIGVNVWEQVEGDERAELVNGFVEDQGERMGYTVALEEENSMSEAWMRPAGQNGIPAAFVVTQGKIAWIGHPSNLDSVLEEIDSGDFDLATAGEAAWNQRVAGVAFRGLQGMLREGRWDLGLELARSMRAELAANDSDMLNIIAWFMSAPEDSPEENIAFGRDTAFYACELTEWSDWGALDTYARTLHLTGDTDQAIEIQTKALSLAEQDDEAPEQILEEMRSSLEDMQG